VSDAAEFLLKFSADGDELVGARWWNYSVRVERHFPRRDLAKLALVGGGLATAALLYLALDDDDPDEAEIAEALALQQREGWDIGGGTAALNLVETSPVDVAGSTEWGRDVARLATLLEPRPLRLKPYYVSTLFQSTSQRTLREQLRPVHAASADVAHARAAALSELIAEGAANDVAVILDLPGEEAVAAAAAFSRHFWPVFGFGNWPHPRGVVDSHQTLAAALYYLPRFQETAAQLGPDRPPVFVLDSARLTPYADDPNQFDNRYLAKLPSAENLQALGVKRLFYVRAAGTEPVELDDLNDEFVAFEAAGLEVRFVSLGDLKTDERTADNRYYWGGSPYSHVLFWPSYRPYGTGFDGRPAPSTQPVRAFRSLDYRPVRRETQFSSRTVGGIAGVGKQKPSGFGLVSLRQDRSVGSVGASRRSGSFGRFTGSYSG
jgi:hypothetical protein